MMIDTILFDMDGTLLPASQDEFTKSYMKRLAAKIAPLGGYDAKQFIKAVWYGADAMNKNDGTQRNCERFWKALTAVLGEAAADMEKFIDAFYSNEFHEVKHDIGIDKDHSALMRMLKDKGYTLALASNPLFPASAMRARLSWIGLSPDDFDFVTDYENSSFCKPMLGYYNGIFEALGKRPEQCLMVGNNALEDGCVAELGASVYLVTDMLEGNGQVPASFGMGSFEEFSALAASMPCVNKRDEAKKDACN